ncbi:MAG: hypothetical protein P8Y69_07890 [Gammaproteobacteria bacterium]|jgi:hypothetical protein
MRAAVSRYRRGLLARWRWLGAQSVRRAASGFDDRYRVSVGDTELTRRKSTKDYYDALVGVRYRIDLALHWSILTRADTSFGDSEGTFLLQANLAWTLGSRELNRILIGYQYKEADFKHGDLELDYTYYGPLAGFNFRF